MANGIYTFEVVKAPAGANGTVLGGINNAGQVTGYFLSADNPYPQAFVDSNGTFTPITVLGRPYTNVPGGINSNGQVAGATGNAQIGINGFLWFPNGSVQEISSQPTATHGLIDQAYGLNDSGQVVGVDRVGQHAGFVWQNGAMSFFQFPGATATEARGINNSGEIVGVYDAGGHDRGFADINGQFSTVDVPGAVDTDPAAVNLAGVIAGTYFDGTHYHGFVDTAGQMQFINAPGASDTWVTGINDSAQLSGYSKPAAGGPMEGFIATDPPAPTVTAAGPAAVGHSLLQPHAMFGLPLHWTHGHHG